MRGFKALLAAGALMLGATLLGATNADAATDGASACHADRHNVCSTWRYRAAVRHLSARPALIKPGAWVSPAGPALVSECYASYPNVRPARANVELMACLTQPDPRQGDRSVMTVHQYHVNHVNHVNRQR